MTRRETTSRVAVAALGSGLAAAALVGCTSDATQPFSVEARGHVCVERAGGPQDFALYEHLLRTPEPATVTAVTLGRPDGVELVEAFVSPVMQDVAEVGASPGWPPPDRVAAKPALGWDERAEVPGAELAADDPYRLWLHVRVPAGRQWVGYEWLEVTYESDGEEAVARTDLSGRFGPDCSS